MSEITDVFHNLDSSGDLELLLNFNKPPAESRASDSDPKQTKQSLSGGYDATNLNQTLSTHAAGSLPASNGTEAHSPKAKTGRDACENKSPPSNEADSSGARPNVRFRVSSKHLILGSRYFKRMLEGPWLESTQLRSKGIAKITLEEQDVENFLILLDILHGYSNKIPQDMALDRLVKFATLVDYYECDNAVNFFARSWLNMIESPSEFTEDVLKMLWVSWVFKHLETFSAMTQLAGRYSTGRVDVFDLPIPDRIVDVINDQRRNNLGQMFYAIHNELAMLEDSEVTCSFDCDSKMSGIIRKRLRPLGILGPPDNLIFGNISFDVVATALRECSSTKFDSSCSCKILSRVMLMVDELEKECLGLKVEIPSGANPLNTNTATLRHYFPNKTAQGLTPEMVTSSTEMSKKMHADLALLNEAHRVGLVKGVMSKRYTAFCDACLTVFGNNSRMVCRGNNFEAIYSGAAVDSSSSDHSHCITAICIKCYESGWRCSVSVQEMSRMVVAPRACRRWQRPVSKLSCNHCKKNILGTFLHCCKCDDFDVCLECVLVGESCRKPGVPGHELMARYLRGNDDEQA